MRELLEKKALWVWIYVVIDAISFIVGIVEVSLWLSNGQGELPVGAVVFSHITAVIIIIYYIYRVLYLYRNEPKKGMWIVFAVLVLIEAVLELFGQKIPYVNGVIDFLALACFVRDLSLVLGKKKVPTDEQ